ncbi:unnamed protein product, partial [Prorocentrum cordatum]
ADEAGAHLVPLSGCISEAVEAREWHRCPSPCARCPACPAAGEAGPSWSVQLGIGLLGLIIGEVGKVVFAAAARLRVALQRAVAPCGIRGIPLAAAATVVEVDLAELAAPQAR